MIFHTSSTIRPPEIMFATISNFIAHAGFFPGRTPTWRPERDMPDMTGKVVIVSGANAGIGYESIKYLLKNGAKVYGLSRTPAKSEEAIKSLNALGYKGQLAFVRCDLADLKSVRTAAEEILEKEKQVSDGYPVHFPHASEVDK
jgi:NADPH:quinone reductase-like Zn-dependent oxidoreductase